VPIREVSGLARDDDSRQLACVTSDSRSPRHSRKKGLESLATASSRRGLAAGLSAYAVNTGSVLQRDSLPFAVLLIRGVVYRKAA
jgi:hypothetical protein